MNYLKKMVKYFSPSLDYEQFLFYLGPSSKTRETRK